MQQSTNKRNAKTVRWMFLLVVGMFGFGFAMVPLYNLLCSVTGLNGSTTGRISDTASVGKTAIDYSRTVTIEFDSTINSGLPWDFYPTVKKVQVHPGEFKTVTYYVKNNSNKTIVGQAIPGITPWQATSHFKKAECFCFSQQTLKPGESKEMPLRFVVAKDLPQGFNTITLSYTFMNTDRSKLKNVNQSPAVHSTL